MLELEVNQSVTIEISAGENNKKYYSSKVVSVSSAEMVILAPMERGVLVPLRTGDLITVSYNDDNAIYSFDAHVQSRQGGVEQTVSVDCPKDIRRVQRRNFVRIDVGLPLVYYFIDEAIGEYSQAFTGRTCDISGGGLQFSTEQSIDSGMVLDMNIDLGDDERVSAIGKVVRAIPVNKGGVVKYSIGVQFTMIDERDRDKIIKFIFQKQRELRQRGLM